MDYHRGDSVQYWKNKKKKNFTSKLNTQSSEQKSRDFTKQRKFYKSMLCSTPGRLQQSFRGEPERLYWQETNSEESNTTMSEMDFKPEL